MVFKKGHKINLGRKCSDSKKQKISIAKKGKPTWASLNKEIVSQKMKGRKITWSDKISEALKGEKNYNWKGGIRIDQQGYIQEYCPQHPFANNHGYVMQHRLVMEKHLGRYLLPTELVHHINGNKQSNVIENLMKWTWSEHGKFHGGHKKNV
jgi:hypothetical protein